MQNDRSLIVMLVISDLRIDPRVERAARTMAEKGYRVTVVWPDASAPYHADKPLDWGPGVSFDALPWWAASGIMRFPWLFEERMHAAAAKYRPFAFHCHDLTTALVGLSAARRTGALCICDFHEWYSENVSWDKRTNAYVSHPAFKRWFFRLAERIVMWRADAVLTVCDSIARELSEKLSRSRRPVYVIRNIPKLEMPAKPYPSLREQLNVPADRFVLLWQGGTGPSRMIEPIIEALAYSPRAVFVIRGPSLDLFGNAYRELARKVGAVERLVLLPPVPSSDVVAAAQGADAGIWTLPNISKNFYYALPNKIFEYLAAGLPVLAADYPEARRMVQDNRVGLCFDPYEPRSIAAQLNRLVEDRSLYLRLRGSISRVLIELRADREWGKLATIYDELKNRGGCIA